MRITLALIILSLSWFNAWAADFSGDGTDDIAIFRPANGLWAVRGVTRWYYGKEGDTPSPGDYDGDGTTNIAVFRPATGLWAVRNISRLYFGKQGDMPIAGGTRRLYLYNPDIFQIDKESGIVRVGYNTQDSGLTVGRAPEWPDWPDGIGHNVIFHGVWTDGDGRMIWNANKAALRIGRMGYSSKWDETTPGDSSLSVGWDVLAGANSAAIGEAVRTDAQSLAVGYGASTLKPRSIALGHFVIADGWSSMAIGSSVSTRADNAMVIGKGIGTFPWGLSNDIPDSLMVGFNTDTDPALFVDSVGIGAGTTSPARKLHVNDVMRLEPRSTAPDNPSQGDLYFDSTDANLKCYDGSSWRDCF